MGDRLLFYREFILTPVAQGQSFYPDPAKLKNALESAVSKGYQIMCSSSKTREVPNSIMLGVPESERGLMLADVSSEMREAIMSEGHFVYRFGEMYCPVEKTASPVKVRKRKS